MYSKKIYAPTSINRMSYDEAIMYCLFLNYNGYTNWQIASDFAEVLVIESPNVEPSFPYWTSDDDHYQKLGCEFYARPMKLIE